MEIERLKKLCLDEIDNNKERIINVAKLIYENPELGYKEVETTKLAVEFFKDLGVKVQENIAVTGCMTSVNKEKVGPKIVVMGELDSLVCPDHKDSNKIGNAHCCGHNIQIAGMLGCAAGIIKSNILEYLDGKIDFIAVPAEECIDLEFRHGLQDKKEIKYVGGKQELLYRGILDDADMAMMFHPIEVENNKKCIIKSPTNGFISKTITFIGKASHAGLCPHLGINAYAMSTLATNNINAQRDTFKEEDKIRVSSIINHGGDVANVVPSKVTMETMVRAATVPAMMEVNEKINKSLNAAALALDGKVIIKDSIGYLPVNSEDKMDELFKKNYLKLIKGDDNSVIPVLHSTASSDFGDISQLMPALHPWTGGISGALHTKEYKVKDIDLACIIPAKAMALTIIDLLYNGAEKAKNIINKFEPQFTKEEYLKFMDENTKVYTYDYLK